MAGQRGLLCSVFSRILTLHEPRTVSGKTKSSLGQLAAWKEQLLLLSSVCTGKVSGALKRYYLNPAEIGVKHDHEDSPK